MKKKISEKDHSSSILQPKQGKKPLARGRKETQRYAAASRLREIGFLEKSIFSPLDMHRKLQFINL